MMSKHRKIEGRSGEDWYVDVDELNAASHLHQTDKKPKGPGSFRGYGGSTLKFEMEDGTVKEVVGPWHSNSTAFFKDTGISNQ
jgi:hypothetical protein